MTQFATEDSVQAEFNDVVLTNATARFRLSKRNGEFWVRMEKPDAREARPGEWMDVRLGLVTGSHHMQVFWVPEGDGNMQLGFPFTWLIPEKRWVSRNSTFVRPPDFPHRSEIWNVVCSRCHTTGVEPHAHIAARRVETEVAELGIACEACHGPGARHVGIRKTEKPGQGDLPPVSGEIVHPKKIAPERASQICGFCHSMKWIDKSESWTLDGFRFRPGDDLEKTTPVVRPAKINEIAGLKEYLEKNPELLRDFFWPDGMIRVSGREYNGLIESPCYKGGKFSCLSCHSLHDSEPAGQLSEKARDNRACTQCHDKFREPAALAGHTHHLANSSGSDCYNCHMPHSTYGILKAIRSHQISSPQVRRDDLAAGRPNACNLCHLDQSLGWTAHHLNRWYQQELPVNMETNHSEIVRLALAGDAGQRVLAAWHLSWPPALQISGTNWAAPILGQLLDDPYAAIRCVAERSLNKISRLTPPGYDFDASPESRPLVAAAVWENWRRELLPPQLSEMRMSVLCLSADPLKQEELFATQLKVRNNRPIRLRE